MAKWKTLKSRVVYKGFFGEVLEDEVLNHQGKQHTYSYVVGPEFTPVVGYNKGKFLIVRQYRYTRRKFTWEFVSGGVDKGSTTLQTAKKELLEESGYQAKKWQKLGKLSCSGCGTSYLAIDLKKVAKPVPEIGGETLEPKLVSKKELESMIKAGQFDKACHVAAFYLAKDYLKL